MAAKILPEIRTNCVVLERVAWGAGQTRWYVAYDQQELSEILSGLARGSSVSCYFDDRIKKSTWSMSTRQQITLIVRESGDCVVAKAEEGKNSIEAAFVAGENDMDEFLADMAEGETVFFGAFPSRDDDGFNAVSWMVPDPSAVGDISH